MHWDVYNMQDIACDLYKNINIIQVESCMHGFHWNTIASNPKLLATLFFLNTHSIGMVYIKLPVKYSCN